MATHKLTEDEIDALIERRQEAARDAAMAAIQRAQRRPDCPPCNGNCNQSRACPARLRAQVEADARASGVSNRWLAGMLALTVAVAVLLGVAKRTGWLA